MQTISQLDPKRSKYLACALIARGDVQMSDMNRNISRMKPQLNLVHWNEDAFKSGTLMYARGIQTSFSHCCSTILHNTTSKVSASHCANDTVHHHDHDHTRYTIRQLQATLFLTICIHIYIFFDSNHFKVYARMLLSTSRIPCSVWVRAFKWVKTVVSEVFFLEICKCHLVLTKSESTQIKTYASANNCCIKDTFADMKRKFARLYKRKVTIGEF